MCNEKATEVDRRAGGNDIAGACVEPRAGLVTGLGAFCDSRLGFL